LFCTIGSNEWNGSWPTMETTITSKQQILNSRGKVPSQGPLPLLINLPVPRLGGQDSSPTAPSRIILACSGTVNRNGWKARWETFNSRPQNWILHP
jgi:hypothetical protein